MDFALTPAQRQLKARAEALAEGEIAARAAEVDRSEAYPWENAAALKAAGFMGITIPKAYGGGGLGYLDAVLVIQALAKRCGVSGRIAVEANMGAVGAIMAYGSEAQKRLAAELVLAGDKPAICITEPAAGSAANEMTTRADRRGAHYVLNGKKHWITGGGAPGSLRGGGQAPVGVLRGGPAFCPDRGDRAGPGADARAGGVHRGGAAVQGDR